MTEKPTFAAMMTATQRAKLAATEPERESHLADARALARELMQSLPADALVVAAAEAGLGLVDVLLRARGIDPLTFALDTEDLVYLGDDDARDPLFGNEDRSPE